MARPSPPYMAWRRSNDGISDWQGAQEVDQKFSSTTRPRKSSSERDFPDALLNSAGGAGCGFSRPSKPAGMSGPPTTIGSSQNPAAAANASAARSRMHSAKQTMPAPASNRAKVPMRHLSVATILRLGYQDWIK